MLRDAHDRQQLLIGDIAGIAPREGLRRRRCNVDPSGPQSVKYKRWTRRNITLSVIEDGLELRERRLRIPCCELADRVRGLQSRVAGSKRHCLSKNLRCLVVLAVRQICFPKGTKYRQVFGCKGPRALEHRDRAVCVPAS